MIATAPHPPLIQRVEETLRELRRNNVRSGIVYAVTIAIAVILVLALIAIALDSTFGWLSQSTRIAISTTALLITIVSFASVTLWVLRQRRQFVELAAQADGAAPMLEERLQTIVSLNSSDRIVPDRQMMHRVLLETQSLYDQVDPAEFVERHSFRIPLATIAVCGVLLLGLLVTQTRSTAVLLSRFVWPSTKLTRTVVDSDFANVVIGVDEPWQFAAEVSGDPVESALLEQRLNASEIVQRTLSLVGANENELRYQIPRVKDSFDYRLTAGDFRSDWMNVKVAKRPRIVHKEVRIISPAYINRPENVLTKIPRSITVVKGSQVILALQVEGEVERAEWILQPEQGLRSMFPTDDQWYQCTLSIEDSVSMTPHLVEPNGLENIDTFELSIKAVEDVAPTVRITKPSPDAAVRPDDKVRIEFEAQDDFGIERAELIVTKTNRETGETTLLQSIPISMNDKRGNKRLTAGADLNLSELGLEHGETIQYRVEVYDKKQLTGDSEQAGAVDQNQTSQPTSEDENKTANARTESSTKTTKSNSSADAPISEKSETTTEMNRNAPESSPSTTQESSPDPQSQSNDPSMAASSQMKQTDPQKSKPAAISDAGAKQEKESNQSTPSEPAEMTDESASNEETPNDPKTPPANSPASSSSKNPQSAPNSQSQSQPSEPSKSKSSQPQDDSSKRPTTRGLDVAKPSKSSTMELKIDKFAGSFEGQARKKLEIAIDPVLQSLKLWLTEAELRLGEAGPSGGTDLAGNTGGESPQQKSLSIAIDRIGESVDAVDALTARTNGTPYAFVGLQVSDIALTHLDPAYSDSVTAKKTTSASRYTLIDSARGQVQRALTRLDELQKRYEREKRAQLMEEKLQEFQKVYRVYIEDTLAKLQAQRDRINDLKRKGVEFELDDEYLARLQEILEARRDLEAELARILSEDPRLLKRFSESSRNQADTLRDQFSLLARRQAQLTKIAEQLTIPDDKIRETGSVPGANRVALRTLEVAYRLTGDLADSLDRFDTWMPLNQTTPTVEGTQAFDAFRQASAVAQQLRVEVLKQAQQSDKDAVEYDEVKALADELVKKLDGLRQRLTTLGSSSTQADLIANATNRLFEVTQVRARILGWRFQIDAIAKDRHGEALAVDQHQLMVDLHEYADKMSTLPRQIAALMPEADGTVPEDIAKLAGALLAKIDTGIEPTQLAGVMSLRKEDLPKATLRLKSADDQFEEAELIFDELMVAVVKILDELPVEDPIASLLRDPTLEEILADLERELPLNEILGIPNRPSNLRIISDWRSQQSGNGSSGQGSGDGSSIAQMIQKMMEAEQKKREQGLRSFSEKIQMRTGSRSRDDMDGGKLEQADERWIKVISRLGDGLLQEQGDNIPGRYRAAIRQYFETISSGR
ncbi:hypothetical protein Poly51_36010 [Rubripirellula tenax]|uniref:Myosin heavy chain n=1 Tax=Rubripirellula tenax TaxID=2528015 RepID=A0A5C6F4W9_9BACT|nr:hypothetical protein [Rubripirellula tenax]TWU54879.1 hypothetical protein Poly51_36010 [Rubripirellula tenax]